MSKIDLSQLITAEDKAQRAQEARLLAAKAECRCRIVAVIDEITQMNLTNALLAHDAVRLRGGTQADAEAASGLTEAEAETVLAARRWIAAMRDVASDAGGDPAAVSWPAPPEGLEALAARF